MAEKENSEAIMQIIELILAGDESPHLRPLLIDLYIENLQADGTAASAYLADCMAADRKLALRLMKMHRTKRGRSPEPVFEQKSFKDALLITRFNSDGVPEAVSTAERRRICEDAGIPDCDQVLKDFNEYKYRLAQWYEREQQLKRAREYLAHLERTRKK